MPFALSLGPLGPTSCYGIFSISNPAAHLSHQKWTTMVHCLCKKQPDQQTSAYKTRATRIQPFITNAHRLPPFTIKHINDRQRMAYHGHALMNSIDDARPSIPGTDAAHPDVPQPSAPSTNDAWPSTPDTNDVLSVTPSTGAAHLSSSGSGDSALPSPVLLTPALCTCSLSSSSSAAPLTPGDSLPHLLPPPRRVAGKVTVRIARSGSIAVSDTAAHDGEELDGDAHVLYVNNLDASSDEERLWGESESDGAEGDDEKEVEKAEGPVRAIMHPVTRTMYILGELLGWGNSARVVRARVLGSPAIVAVRASPVRALAYDIFRMPGKKGTKASVRARRAVSRAVREVVEEVEVMRRISESGAPYLVKMRDAWMEKGGPAGALLYVVMVSADPVLRAWC